MTMTYSPVGSVLTERPPAAAVPTNSNFSHSTTGHPRQFMESPTNQPQPSLTQPARQTSTGEYDVVYDDAEGRPILAFTAGQWFDVTSHSPRPVSVRHALRRDPAWAGAVVQTICLWMRSNPQHERSFDLATELALAIGELARQKTSQALAGIPG